MSGCKRLFALDRYDGLEGIRRSGERGVGREQHSRRLGASEEKKVVGLRASPEDRAGDPDPAVFDVGFVRRRRLLRALPLLRRGGFFFLRRFLLPRRFPFGSAGQFDVLLAEKGRAPGDSDAATVEAASGTINAL